MRDATKKAEERPGDELARLRKRVAELERSERKWKQERERLRDSEARLTEFLRNIPNHHLLLLDPALNVVAANDIVLTTLSAQFGVQKEELIGRSFLELMPGFEGSDRHTRYLEVLRTGVPFFRPEVTPLLPIGDLLFSISVFKVGKGLGILATDITARKEAQAALQESEQKYAALVEQASDGVLILQDGVLKFANRALADILGYSVEQLTWKRMLGLVAPAHRAMAAEKYRLRLAGRHFPPYEIQVVRKDGTIKDVEISASRFQYEGRPATMAIVRDIEERKRTLQALRDSEERYRRFFEDSPTALWEIDASYVKAFSNRLRKTGVTDFKAYFENHPDEARLCGQRVKLVHMNRASLELFEAGSGEELRSKLRLIFPKESTGMFSKGIVAVAEGRTSFEREVGSYTLTGKPKHIFYKWSALPHYEETAARLLVSLVDITSRVQLEQERLKSQKLESLGVLAGGIAHDFNNFLTAISTNIAMARMYGNLDHDIADMLSDAEKASARAKALTQQLLAFAKGGDPVKRTVRLGELLRDTAAFALSGSNVKSVFSLPEDLRLVMIDEGQIGQVIHNLVINADQAMPGGGTVEIAAENVVVDIGEGSLPLERGNYVKVTVTDHGIGISRKHLDRIFDPFYTTKKRGSGLGLATCYTIMKNHAGHIRVHSEVDMGTRIELFLPASEEAPVRGEQDRKASLRGEGRVLLVDDEPMIRRAGAAMLRRFGYEATAAQNGEEAIRRYEEAVRAEEPFDAVIMDLTIPGDKGGRETVAALLALDPDARVIVSSGYSDDPVMSHFEQYGFCDVIAKPYRLEDVAAVLRRVLSERDG